MVDAARRALDVITAAATTWIAAIAANRADTPETTRHKLEDFVAEVLATIEVIGDDIAPRTKDE